MGALVRLRCILFYPAMASAMMTFAICAADAADPQYCSKGEAKWAMKADDPPGARQWYKYGKLWPPRPRPVGKPQAYIHKFHHAHYWPYPYLQQDRVVVEEAMDRQVANGWITETTLYNYHFDPDTHEISTAGRMHLRWILERTPLNHRLAFVATAEDQEVSQLRLASTKLAAEEMVGPENVPPIMLRVASPYGRPALEVDLIRKAELQTMPEPRIPYSDSSIGGQ